MIEPLLLEPCLDAQGELIGAVMACEPHTPGEPMLLQPCEESISYSQLRAKITGLLVRRISYEYHAPICPSNPQRSSYTAAHWPGGIIASPRHPFWRNDHWNIYDQVEAEVELIDPLGRSFMANLRAGGIGYGTDAIVPVSIAQYPSGLFLKAKADLSVTPRFCYVDRPYGVTPWRPDRCCPPIGGTYLPERSQCRILWAQWPYAICIRQRNDWQSCDEYPPEEIRGKKFRASKFLYGSFEFRILFPNMFLTPEQMAVFSIRDFTHAVQNEPREALFFYNMAKLNVRGDLFLLRQRLIVGREVVTKEAGWADDVEITRIQPSTMVAFEGYRAMTWGNHWTGWNLTSNCLDHGQNLDTRRDLRTGTFTCEMWGN